MSEKKTTLPEAAAADGKETKIDVVAGNAKALVDRRPRTPPRKKKTRCF